MWIELQLLGPGIQRRSFASLACPLPPRPWQIALGSKTAAERLAVFLLNMAERIGTERDGLCAFDLPMSRRDISESLGLTIETVSRQLTKLRDDGVIETIGRSKVILRRPELLRERAGYSTRSCAISSS